MTAVDSTLRHLRLLTDTIAAVNSSLDLQEVLGSSPGTSRTLSGRTPASCTSTTSSRTARAPRDPREPCGGDDADAPHAARRRDHGRGRGRAGAGDDPGAGASRPAFQAVPEPSGGRVRVDPCCPDSRAREARGSPERWHAGASGVHGRRDRVPRRDRIAGRADDRARTALRGGAAPRGGAGGPRAHLGGGVRVALPRGVAGGDRQTTMESLHAPGPHSSSRTARSHGPRDARVRTRCDFRCAGSGARSASWSATATRRSRTTTGLCSRRSRTTRRWRSSTGAR